MTYVIQWRYRREVMTTAPMDEKEVEQTKKEIEDMGYKVLGVYKNDQA